ncbi:MAG TPA: protein kinase [Bryobacteraceae bacterium]|nr:protein kinase [Bryobacteraceae bacterium]
MRPRLAAPALDKIEETTVDRIGRYQILGEIGRGAMGVVYKARDPAIGRTIAIKSIRLEDLTDAAERDRLRERLFREAQSAGILSHPNIVTIYDIGEEDGMAYIFMEHVNGPPLEKMLRSAQPPDKETLLSILRQTAAALDYAHKKGIVHRDIKPANILIHEDGAAKVTDFGVAKIISQKMTVAGTMMGTPSYMSPEQIRGEAEVSGRADQFALGVIAYETFTGEKPFTAESLPSLLYKIIREDFLAPQRLNPTLGAPIEAVFRRVLAKNPAERYDNCSDFVAALSTACNRVAGWTPLPHGASQTIPTGGSAASIAAEIGGAAEDFAETVVETGRAAPAEPAPAAAPFLPPPRDPRKRFESTHRVRNGVLTAAAAAVLGAGGFFAFRSLYTPLPHEIAKASAPPVAAAQSVAPPPAASTPLPKPAMPEPQAEQKSQAQDETKAEPPPAAEPVERPLASAEARAANRTPAPGEADLPSQGSFHLTTTPEGSVALFDHNSALSCTSPCSITLPAGRHTFVVRRAGYRDAQRIIDIPRDTGLIVNLEKMEGVLSVTSNPPGLPVSIDGQLELRKTPASFALAPGPHRVEVTKGADKQAFVVEIHDGSTVSRAVDWGP